MIKSVLLGAVTWEILVASRVISPSIGAILVEWFMLPPANAAFKSNGFKVVHCKLDDHGLNIDHLKTLLKTNKVAAVYTTPHHQYPTTVSMTMERRLKLLYLSKEYQFRIIG